MHYCEFRIFFDRWYKAAMHSAADFLKQSPATAEEIVIDSFVAVWHNLHKLPTDHDRAAYLFATVRNKCINFASKNKSNPVKQLSDLDLNIRYDCCEINALAIDYILTDIGQIIKKFKPQQRKIMSLVLIGWTNERIGRALGISNKTVWSTKHKCVQKIRSILADENKLQKYSTWVTG